MKTTDEPGRRVICATWPSTQIQPSFAIQAPIFWLTTRTGHGASADDAAGRVGLRHARHLTGSPADSDG